MILKPSPSDLLPLCAGDHRVRWVGKEPEPEPIRSCQHAERNEQGQRVWCKTCGNADGSRIASFTP